MSIVCVQVGQCGNQVGQAFYNCIYEDAKRANERDKSLYATDSLQRFFRTLDGASCGSPCARAVLVDTESKVVQCMQRGAGKCTAWIYPQLSDDSFTHHGSGNNWALGYCVNGPPLLPSVMENIRREMEQADSVEGFMTFMSGAGGTGSGLGSLVSEALRDEYSKKYRVAQLTWPYQSSRDVVIQDYNLIFTLAHLYTSSDGILVMQNDHLHSICSRVLRMKDFSFREMNQIIAHLLGSVFQPSQDLLWSQRNAPCRPKTTPLADLVSHLCSDSSYKLLGVRGVPMIRPEIHAYSTFLWEPILKTLRQMLITNSHIDLGLNWSHTKVQEDIRNKSLASYLVLRGKDSFMVDPAPLEEVKLYASVPRTGPPLQARYHNHSFNGYEKFGSLVSNDQFHLPALEITVKSGWKLFHSRAYLHHFADKGMVDRDIFDTFIQAEQVIHDYKSIV